MSGETKKPDTGSQVPTKGRDKKTTGGTQNKRQDPQAQNKKSQEERY